MVEIWKDEKVMAPNKDVSQALERLRGGFVSHDILEAVDRFDDVRPSISDDGYQPLEVRGEAVEAAQDGDRASVNIQLR